MVRITVENVKATALPGRTRAELDLTHARTRVVWGTEVYNTTGLQDLGPREYSLVTRAVRYAQPRVQRALAPAVGTAQATATIYVSEEAGNERCRFVLS